MKNHQDYQVHRHIYHLPEFPANGVSTIIIIFGGKNTYPLRKFLVCSTVLLVMGTIWYSRSSEGDLFRIPETRLLLALPLPFYVPPAPGNHCSTFCFYEFDYFRFHICMRSYSICLLCLVCFTLHNVLQLHPCCPNDRISFFFFSVLCLLSF